MTDVREWARQQGIDVHARGNISREVISRYDAAHPAPISHLQVLGGPLAVPQTQIDAALRALAGSLS